MKIFYFKLLVSLLAIACDIYCYACWYDEKFVTFGFCSRLCNSKFHNLIRISYFKMQSLVENYTSECSFANDPWLDLVYVADSFDNYDGVIMGAMASQITSLTIVYSTVYSVADQRKHQSFESLAFVRGIHRGPVNSPHKWPVTREMFPLDDVIMPIQLVAIRSQQFFVHAMTARLFCRVQNFIK